MSGQPLAPGQFGWHGSLEPVTPNQFLNLDRALDPRALPTHPVHSPLSTLPAARTRLSQTAPGVGPMIAPPPDDRFDVWDPANVAPLAAYLATESCPFTGATFYIQGGAVKVVHPWSFGEGVERDGRWSIDELAGALAPFA